MIAYAEQGNQDHVKNITNVQDEANVAEPAQDEKNVVEIDVQKPPHTQDLIMPGITFVN